MMLTPLSNVEYLEFLFQDDDLFVINKPPGLRVIPDGYQPGLLSVRAMLEKSYGQAWIVHRLDKDTSGVLLAARNPKTHKELNLLFQNREIRKEYHAIVICEVAFPAHLELDAPLLVNGDRRHRTIVDPIAGKYAKTDFELIQQFSKCALVRALPKTGYTHQIRAHAFHAGFPLLGDTLYRFPASKLPQMGMLPAFSRTALHAYRITFAHPVTGKKMEFISPYPADFAEFLQSIN